MIFISRHTRLKVVLRPTIVQVVNNKSGSEESVRHHSVIVEFQGGIFDTRRWRELSRPEAPPKFDIIKSEADLIKHLQENPYFNKDYSEMKVESVADKRARLLHELNKLDAEDGNVAAGDVVLGEVDGETLSDDLDVPAAPKAPKAPKPKPIGKRTGAKGPQPNSDSVVDV